MFAKLAVSAVAAKTRFAAPWPLEMLRAWSNGWFGEAAPQRWAAAPAAGQGRSRKI